jgi:integrase
VRLLARPGQTMISSSVSRMVDPSIPAETGLSGGPSSTRRGSRTHEFTMVATAGTLLIDQDVHLRVVQEILGHTDIRVTQRYTHVSTAAARDAADRVGVALWSEG